MVLGLLYCITLNMEITLRRATFSGLGSPGEQKSGTFRELKVPLSFVLLRYHLGGELSVYFRSYVVLLGTEVTPPLGVGLAVGAGVVTEELQFGSKL